MGTIGKPFGSHWAAIGEPLGNRAGHTAGSGFTLALSFGLTARGGIGKPGFVRQINFIIRG